MGKDEKDKKELEQTEEKEDKGPQPTFSFANVNRKWSMMYMRAETQVERAFAKAQTIVQDIDADDKDVDAALDKVESAMEQRNKVLIQVIEDVPVSWLMSDTPDDLAWDDVTALDWVRADRTGDLTQALKDKMQSPAGN